MRSKSKRRRLDFRKSEARRPDFRKPSYANLSYANLSDTDLSDTNLNGAYLSDVDLNGAILNDTNFTGCPTLHQAKGLDTVVHRGASNLDARTLRACVNHLPVVFLRGVGYTNEEIENLCAMYRQGIVYYSCFLSHGSDDLPFAERLRADLLSQSVSCWHHRHDMQGGDFWRKQVSAAIRLHDKLVVICSKGGLLRAHVVDEILEGIEQERETGNQKLFPVRLDDFILGKEMEQVIAARLPLQQRQNWAQYLKEYHIPDFSGWKEHDAYQTEFKKLLNALKHPQHR